MSATDDEARQRLVFALIAGCQPEECQGQDVAIKASELWLLCGIVGDLRREADRERRHRRKLERERVRLPVGDVFVPPAWHPEVGK